MNANFPTRTPHLCAMALLAILSFKAYGVTIHQDTPHVRGYSEAGDEFGAVQTTGDFNGDGYMDLAIGTPNESMSIGDWGNIWGNVSGVGAVQIFYGSATGLKLSHKSENQFWRRRVDSISPPREEERYGAALAAGDFNADGVFDLAVGIPGYDISLGSGQFISRAGAVEILLGSTNGLTRQGGDWFLTQDSPSVQGTAGFRDHFGSSLAAGYLQSQSQTLQSNHSQKNMQSIRPYDLVVGSYNDNNENLVGGGSINIFYGSPLGLRAPTHGPNLWHQENVVLPDGEVPFSNVEFGFSVAVGYFNQTSSAQANGGARRMNIAIGVPQFYMPNTGELAARPGIVIILDPENNSTSSTYSPQSFAFYRGYRVPGEFSPSIPGQPLPGAPGWDRFGQTLAFGNFNAFGFDELVVGAPDLTDYDGSSYFADSGSVTVITNDPYITTPPLIHAVNWHQDSPEVGDAREDIYPIWGPTFTNGDLFGSSLAVGDYNGDTYPDLFIGAPGESFYSTSNEDIGVGHVLFGSWLYGLRGSTPTGNHSYNLLTQYHESSGNGGNEWHDAFGLSATAGDFDGNGVDDISVGIPKEDIGSLVDAGAVTVFPNWYN